MELSRRLLAVAGLVTPGNRLADIGTDHGYIPIYLIKEKKISHAIAMDVNSGPLQRAADHIREEELTEKIETRQSDGLQKLAPGEAESAVIAGMGGALTIRILEDGRETAERLSELILQPQSEIARVRRWLVKNGFRIEEEEMILEDGKYYPMMRAVPQRLIRDAKGEGEECGEAHLREIDALYGPILLKKKAPCLRKYLEWEKGVKEHILRQLADAAGETAAERRREVELALEKNRQAREEIE